MRALHYAHTAQRECKLGLRPSCSRLCRWVLGGHCPAAQVRTHPPHKVNCQLAALREEAGGLGQEVEVLRQGAHWGVRRLERSGGGCSTRSSHNLASHKAPGPGCALQLSLRSRLIAS